MYVYICIYHSKDRKNRISVSGNICKRKYNIM